MTFRGARTDYNRLEEAISREFIHPWKLHDETIGDMPICRPSKVMDMWAMYSASGRVIEILEFRGREVFNT